MLIERFHEESSVGMRECYICKTRKNYLHFTYVPDVGPYRDDICLECANKIPSHIPERQKIKFLEERVKKEGINV